MRRKKQRPSDRRASKGFPNPIDVHVGNRMRVRRTLMGLTQEKLGEGLGLSFQQIQKYERGTNRVSSSRLFDLGRILGVPIAYFFDEMGADVMAQSPGQMQRAKPAAIDLPADPATKRETLELVRVYCRIKDRSVRRRFTDVVRSIGSK